MSAGSVPPPRLLDVRRADPGSGPARGGASPEELGKGQMGPALTGSLPANFTFFDRDFLLGIPVNLLLSPQKCQGVPFFRNLSKFATLQRPH